MIATLHGLEPPPPSRARVLEIGCGAGGNLLALAYAAPEVRAVGFDLAHTAIEEAKAAAAEVGIANAEFHHADVMDLTEGQLGEFDYVVSHGVYAWIPPAARDALLGVVKSHLAPGGIAYVSYNAHPGGYLRRLLREAALWHSRDEQPGPAQAEKARELFEFLELRVSEDPYGGMLGLEVPVLAKSPQHRLDPRRAVGLLGAGVVPRVRRARPPRTGSSYLAEASPARAVAAELSGRGRAAARRDRRRRPDRARAVPGPAAVPALPLDDALPRGHRGRGRAWSPARCARCCSPPARRARRSRTGCAAARSSCSPTRGRRCCRSRSCAPGSTPTPTS